jgi:uncharacterized protein YbcI
VADREGAAHTQQDQKELIAAEILRVQEESYGTGAFHTEVVYEDNVVIVILDVELSQAERTLLDAGDGEAVKATREAFQRAIAPTFTAVVERATGRRVVSFFSNLNIDPIYAVEVFRLAPHHGGGV